MTYKELAKVILDNPKQWDNDVTVYNNYVDEYYRSTDYGFTTGADIVDDDHLIICY